MRRFVCYTIVLMSLAGFSAHADAVDKTGTLWSPFLEWSFSNPSHSGNPFDLIATATFTHTDSGTAVTTELFYSGGSTWKLRFTGTITGNWSFVTSSADAELDGHSGIVTITSQQNSNIHGFLTSFGNKFARQDNTGKLKGFLFNVYQSENTPLDLTQDFPQRGETSLYLTREVYEAYVDTTDSLGFQTIFMHISNSWWTLDAMAGGEVEDDSPDMQTFQALENIISYAHSRGMHVHIWAWGDDSRDWVSPYNNGSPPNLTNSSTDYRLWRYVAARLGPLPGWSMGYGFDLQEWVQSDEVNRWANFINTKSGWNHLITGRFIDANQQNYPDVGFVSHSNDCCTQASYETVVNSLDADRNRPAAYTDRHYLGRLGFITETWTRRALWIMAMAGGHGGWWGKEGSWGADQAYSQNFATSKVAHRTFFANRFRVDLARAINLTNGYALKSEGNSYYIFYKENANSIDMSLSGMNGSQPAIAIDTTKMYAEINLGTLSPGTHTWTAPYSSDWAIAVGDFGAAPDVDTTAPTNLSPD